MDLTYEEDGDGGVNKDGPARSVRSRDRVGQQAEQEYIQGIEVMMASTRVSAKNSAQVLDAYHAYTARESVTPLAS